MKKNLLGKMVITGIISAAMLASTAASTWAADKSDKDVLRVGMECAYAPFNWTQDTDTTPDGSKAEPIYGSDYYAYGYDVAVAQKLADQLGMKLEIHKVEWSSIGISMDAGDYDCIIAGMGKTAEREKSYAFTEPYYYRDNLRNSDLRSNPCFTRVCGVVRCGEKRWNLLSSQRICNMFATKISKKYRTLFGDRHWRVSFLLCRFCIGSYAVLIF